MSDSKYPGSEKHSCDASYGCINQSIYKMVSSKTYCRTLIKIETNSHAWTSLERTNYVTQYACSSCYGNLMSKEKI